MDKMLFEFMKLYGTTLTLIALSGILFLGILKFFKVFDKVPKAKRKYIYGGISAGFSILASVVYLWFNGDLTWAMIVALCTSIYTLNQVGYSAYETFGVRSVLQKLGVLILTLVAQGKMVELGLVEKKEKPIIEKEVEPVAESKKITLPLRK